MTCLIVERMIAYVAIWHVQKSKKAASIAE